MNPTLHIVSSTGSYFIGSMAMALLTFVLLWPLAGLLAQLLIRINLPQKPELHSTWRSSAAQGLVLMSLVIYCLPALALFDDDEDAPPRA